MKKYERQAKIWIFFPNEHFSITGFLPTNQLVMPNWVETCHLKNLFWFVLTLLASSMPDLLQERPLVFQPHSLNLLSQLVQSYGLGSPYSWWRDQVLIA